MAFNGWANYETWCVSLWLSNDEGLYDETRAMAAEYDGGQGAHAAYELGKALKEYVDDLAEATCPGCRSGASFVADLVGAALSEVDWDEIGANLIEEVDE